MIGRHVPTIREEEEEEGEARTKEKRATSIKPGLACLPTSYSLLHTWLFGAEREREKDATDIATTRMTHEETLLRSQQAGTDRINSVQARGWNSLTHGLTHLLTHALIHGLTHLLTH